MKTNQLLSKFVTTGTRLVVFAALMITFISRVTSVAAAAVPVDLCATPGSVLMPDGATVTIWGYTLGDCSSSPVAGLPGGPTIVVNEGDVVTVTLHNNLTEATSLLFPGQAMVPDFTGAAPGSSKSYTFTASDPGTHLYEAGLVANAEHQVPMGLYGALIVRSATTGQAYDSASTAYDDEAVLVLSEIDPLLNNGDPASFDMRDYHPRYWLINGKAYPQTDPINTVAGNKVLLRYVNAGLQAHSMGVLGLNQNIIAIDGSRLSSSRYSVAESIAPGRTMDTIATIPASATLGSMFALYEANFLQHNNNAAGFGGMLTFLTLAPPPPPSDDTVGPHTGPVTLTPSKSNGSASVSVSASIDDTLNGAINTSNIQAAEFYIDTTLGGPTSLAPADATFDSATESVVATISPATLAGLSAGSHTVYVRGQDAAGNWGSFSSAILNLDKLGPATSGLGLNKNPSNGTVNVVLTGTANDGSNGNSNIAAAEYSIDGNAPVSMTVASPNASISSLSATISAATVSALSDGTHTISVRSEDALGNWGSAVTTSLIVDKTGPATSGGIANPSPNNGTLGVNSSLAVVRVTATFTDVLSKVSIAEGFIDVVGPNGTGFVFVATDGVFNSASENGYADVPLSTVNTLSAGNHTIYVHGKDSSGNWGATFPVSLVIEKQAPTVSGVTLAPSASNNTAVVVSATGNDVATGNSNINKGEYFIDTLGTVGTGTAMSAVTPSPTATISATIPAATISALTAGNHTVYVRARDAAGNWSTAASGTLLIDRTAPTFTSITLTPSSIAGGTASVGLTVNGASDPLVGGLASGVTGGEYWFGTTNITPGTGTAFNGLTANINTSALAGGTYTVRVRIHDGAGNWSTGTNGVRTATLTVVVDTTPPTFSGITLTSNSVLAGTASVGLTVNGATDPVVSGFASGVYGGEFWINPPTSSTPPAGSGTQFTGTSASIPVGSFAAGSYTVSVRMRDVAGNWSTGGGGIRTATLTVYSDNIFANGFETGTTPWGWTSASTTTTSRLNITTTSPLVGTRSLQAQGNNTNYVQFNFGTTLIPATATYDALFFFNPNNNASTGQDIFAAATSSAFSTQLFHVRYRRNGAQPQVQIQVGATANATWVNITNNASNRIEVVWQSGSTLQLYVNGVLSDTLSAGAGSVGAVRFGSVTSGTSNTLEFFDGFASKRSVLTLFP